MNKCSTCNVTYPPAFVFCSNCGRPIQPVPAIISRDFSREVRAANRRAGVAQALMGILMFLFGVGLTSLAHGSHGGIIFIGLLAGGLVSTVVGTLRVIFGFGNGA